jgi:hypothetical protein
MVYAKLLSLLNASCCFLFLHLLAFGLFRQLLDIDLRGQATIGRDRLSTSQVLEGLQVLIGEGVGANRAERSRRARLGSEELELS